MSFVSKEDYCKANDITLRPRSHFELDVTYVKVILGSQGAFKSSSPYKCIFENG